MTLLAIAQDVASVVGVPQPTSVTDMDVDQAQMLGLIRLVANELARDVDWNILRRTHSFATVADERQPGSMPAGFSRFTMVDRKVRFTVGDNSPMVGPVTPDQWRTIAVQPVPAVGSYWRVIGNEIYIRQAPAANVSISFEYFTKYYVRGEDGAEKARFSENEDETDIDNDLIVLGGIYKWKRAQGLDYAEEMADYERAKLTVSGRDNGIQTVFESSDYCGDLQPALYPGVINGEIIG